MAETSTASAPDVDEFLSGFGVSLAHFGVKGMKWGVRKARTSSGGGSPKAKKSTSTSSGVDMTSMKAVGKEVAKAAVKYGLPSAAIAVGAGVPLAATLGVSVKVLDDPAVKEALAPVGSAVKSMTKAIGHIPMAEIPKVSSPFGTKIMTKNPDLNANYINGEWPMHRSDSGDLVPNPNYVGLRK